MKGGKGDVDTPFWSWDTGLSGTKMTEGKPKSPKNHIFWKKHFLRGSRGENLGELRPQVLDSPMHIINENIFVFDLAGGHPKSSNFS